MWSRWAILTFAFAIGVSAQQPGSWTFRDATGACQATLPADWSSNIPGMAVDQRNTVRMMLVFDSEFRMKLLTDADQRSMRIERVFENTGRRIFFENRLVSFSPARPWRLWVAAAGGSCHALFSLKPGASEDAVRRVAMSVGPVD